jgi:cobalt/nickel transport system permease protein
MVGHLSSSEDRRWLAASMGTLLSKSYELSDEVYLAMQARGFHGEVQVLDELVWRGRDGMWLVAFLLIAALAIWAGRI